MDQRLRDHAFALLYAYKTHRRFAIFFSLAVVLPPSFANAQTPLNPVVENIEATPLTLFSEKTGIWPGDTIDAEKLNTESVSVFESLERVTGVQSRGSLSSGSPGFSLRASQSASRNLGLLDGIPLNLGDGVGTQELLLPRENLGEIAVIKGPASLFYGSGAMGGAVNFKTSFVDRQRLRVNGGSFGQRGLFGSVVPLATDRHRIQVTGFSESIDGDFDYKSLSNSATGTRERNDVHTQRGTLYGEHLIEGYELSYRGLLAQTQGSSPGSIVSPRPMRYQKRGEVYGLKVSKKVAPRWDVKFAPSFVKTRNNTYTETTQSLYQSEAYRAGGTFSAFHNSSDDYNLSLFFDAKEDYFSERSGALITKSEKIYEPGMLFDAPFSEDIRLQAGGRYLPEYGLIVKMLGLRQVQGAKDFWVTYSEGFSRPTLSDRFSSDPFFVGNPELNPEEAKQMEVGASQTSDRENPIFWKRLAYEAAVYSTTYENLFISEADSGGVYRKKNLEQAIAWGVDGVVSLPVDLWIFELGYSYLDANSRKKPIPYTTEQQISASIQHFFGPLAFELRDTQVLNYQYGQGHKDMWDWNTTDFNVRTLGFTDWIFTAGVSNLLDQPRMYTKDFPEPQRRYHASLERQF